MGLGECSEDGMFCRFFLSFFRSSENGMKISGSVQKKGHSVYIVGQAI